MWAVRDRLAGIVLVEGLVHVQKGRLLTNWRCTRGEVSEVEVPRLEAMQNTRFEGVFSIDIE